VRDLLFCFQRGKSRLGGFARHRADRDSNPAVGQVEGDHIGEAGAPGFGSGLGCGLAAFGLDPDDHVFGKCARCHKQWHGSSDYHGKAPHEFAPLIDPAPPCL